jgi:hypothetical protein
MDVLPARDVEVFTLSAPKGGAPAIRELPVSLEKPWSITILDEGPPEPAIGHRKTALHLSRQAFLRRAVTSKIAARQLTAVKLERLMARYAGKEWLPSRLTHLDFPESERADVLRGLKTYVASSPENARIFADLYGHLPEASRALEPDVLKTIKNAGASR